MFINLKMIFNRLKPFVFLFLVVMQISIFGNTQEISRLPEDQFLREIAINFFSKVQIDEVFLPICSISDGEFSVDKCYSVTESICIEKVNAAKISCIVDEDDFEKRPGIYYFDMTLEDGTITQITNCFSVKFHNAITDVGGQINEQCY